MNAMAARLSDCLVRDGTLPADVVRAATARQAVYGGTLDTALLELGALDEPTLWGALATATGVPIPDAAMFENPDPAAAVVFDATWSRRCRAVPVGQRDGTLQICCSEPLDEAQLAEARAALGRPFELYVVPEVRLAAARQAVYGEPMPPRLLRVLAHLLGAQPVRSWVKALRPKREGGPGAASAPASAEGGAPRPGQTAPTQRGMPAAHATLAGFAIDEKELADALTEAEFDVPPTTAVAEPADIIESRPSRAAPEGATPDGAASSAGAADEVARALAAGDDARAPVGLGIPVSVTITGITGPIIPLTRVAAPASTDAEPAADEQEEQLCAVADDAEAGARLAALRVLRTRLDRPRVRQLAEKLRADLAGPSERGVLAAGALGELRDGQAVPALIAALGGAPALARTAERALVEITQQDFGTSAKKWNAWWESHKAVERVEWLLEGLSHKSPEIRFSSAEELRLITGEYFGYHFDLPKREREEARARWQAWWQQSGRGRASEPL
jgi:Type II secretion system (T2SS), protein E, N-terminal domain